MTLIDKIRNVDSGKLKLLFGAGTSNWNSDGYVNVDIRQTKTVNVVCDLSKKLPWKDNEVDEIHAESVIEHIPMGKDYVNTIRVLTEWNRILKPGCLLTLKIPDLAVLCKRYDYESGTVINYLYGGQDYPENTHVAGFSIASFYRIFKESNFEYVGYEKPESYPLEIEIIGRKK